MIQIPEQILLLIEKRLKGQSDETEGELLQQWRGESKSHDTIYRQLEKVWQESGIILQEPVYDVENAWDKVDIRLERGKNKGRVRLISRLAMVGSPPNPSPEMLLSEIFSESDTSSSWWVRGLE